jgi:hypothetical protein
VIDATRRPAQDLLGQALRSDTDWPRDGPAFEGRLGNQSLRQGVVEAGSYAGTCHYDQQRTLSGLLLMLTRSESVADGPALRWHLMGGALRD